MTTKSAMRIESTDGRFWCKLIDWLGTHLVEKDSTTITLLLNGQEPQLHDVAVTQWQPYETAVQHPTHLAMQALLAYMQHHHMPRLVTRTRIIIAPGYTFRVASGLITNFHQPKSTLLLLVAAATGGNWQQVYDYALHNGFRFLSYGDGSLLWIPEGSRVANAMP